MIKITIFLEESTETSVKHLVTIHMSDMVVIDISYNTFRNCMGGDLIRPAPT